MKTLSFVFITLLFALCGCSKIDVATSDSLTSDQLEQIFRNHKVDGNNAVALKKQSLGTESYLLTIHGYANNMAVCVKLIQPYNNDPSMSVVSGHYYCEILE